MARLLDPDLDSSDQDYKYACDNAAERQFVEELWEHYRPFADKDFPQKIRLNFHNHFWEMFLACALQYLGYDLERKTKSAGPDIQIKWGGSSIWVEATAPSSGEGPDGIAPLTDDQEGFRVPEEQIILRYAGAIREKHEKYLYYREKSIIADTEPYVIAINRGKIRCVYGCYGEALYVAQAVLPIGPLTLWVKNWERPEESLSGYSYRPQIQKRSGSGVPTDSFLRGEFEGISGVLSSRVSIGTHPAEAGMNQDFVFVHNPLARNKIPEGWLRGMGREYHVDIMASEFTLRPIGKG